MTTDFAILVGEADAALDQELSDGLDVVNEAATVGITPQLELTVSARDAAGLVAVPAAGRGAPAPASAWCGCARTSAAPGSAAT